MQAAMKQVLAAAEATAAELEGRRLDSALLLLFPGRWKSSTGKQHLQLNPAVSCEPPRVLWCVVLVQCAVMQLAI